MEIERRRPTAVLAHHAILVVLAAAYVMATFATASALPFLTRSGSSVLDEHGKQFRFTSFNVPNLHYLEAKQSIATPQKIGGRVTRTYVISVATKDDNGSYVHVAAGTNGNPPLNSAPLGWKPIPQVTPSSVQLYANEELFVALDQAFAIAGELGVRLILPFIDRWQWWGGVKEFASLYGGSFDDFFRNQEIIDGYLSVVRYILNRRNTVTGIQYKDDGAVFAWETGNELTTSDFKPVPGNWTTAVAKFVKEIDQNHLLLDGQYGLYGWDPISVDSPLVDIFSNHYYDNGQSYAGRAINDTAYFSSKGKAFIIGEFGLASFDKLSGLVSTFETLQNATGCMIWSLRYHARDGGFYTHSEGAPFSSYHWPGFPTTADGTFPPDEQKIVNMMHESAQKLSPRTPYMEERPVPAPYLTLNITSNAYVELRWTGSTGAASYVVERTDSSSYGRWSVLNSTILDNKGYGAALYVDSVNVTGKELLYRVTGVNKHGDSGPSNVAKLTL
ncbi:glycoside hydrolase superfamily [Zopfochytrium polystomum]|nr:glycoside hydrolase superfamily [Zopfochytrium polystomum]